MVQVMSWFRKSSSHYLIQCWSISTSSYAYLNYDDLYSLYGIIFLRKNYCATFSFYKSRHPYQADTSFRVTCSWMSMTLARYTEPNKVPHVITHVARVGTFTVVTRRRILKKKIKWNNTYHSGKADLGQYHGWWCLGSWCRQVISSHDID